MKVANRLIVCIIILLISCAHYCTAKNNPISTSLKAVKIETDGSIQTKNMFDLFSCCSSTSDNKREIVAKAADSKIFDVKKSIEVLTYLGLWYLFSGYYNIYNKQSLNILKMPWFVATGHFNPTRSQICMKEKDYVINL